MPGPPSPGQRLALTNGATLNLDQVVHEYAGKRLIFRATLEGAGPVVAKFYLGRVRQWPEWRRGVRGARALETAGVPAPRLHYAGFESGLSAWLCVLDWVEADEPWPPQTETLSSDLHQRLLQTLAEHHQAGLRQHDLNWLNFIPREGRLYAIDGDRVRRQRHPLDRRQARHHLLRLYASKSRLPEAEAVEGYTLYCQLRGWPCSQADGHAFLQDLRRARLRQARRVAARAARGWKHYPRTRHQAIHIIRDRRHLKSDRAVALARALHENGTTEGYQDAETIGARRIDLPPGPLPGLLRPWITRQAALRTWRHALVLMRLGMPTPRPLAISWSSDGHAWLIQRWPAGLQTLDRISREMNTETKETTLEQASIALQQLARAGLHQPIGSTEELGWDGTHIWLLNAQGLRFGLPDSPQLQRAAEREWKKVSDLLSAVSREHAP